MMLESFWLFSEFELINVAGSSKNKSDVTKKVIFSDGIRPGGDLTELDGSSEPRLPYRRPGRVLKRVGTPPGMRHAKHTESL